LFINVRKLSTDPTFNIQIGGPSSALISPVRLTPIIPTQTFLIPYNFFNTPENFTDLKDFIPNIEDTSFTIQFSDEIFGEIIEKLPTIKTIIERFIE